MNKPKKIVSYYRRTILLLTIATTIIVASLLMLTEYINFSHNKRDFRKNYIDDQKKYIKYICENELENIINQKKRLETDVYNELEDFINQADQLAHNLYEKYKGSKTQAEIQTIIIDAVMAFNGAHHNSNIFITTIDGFGVAYVDHPEFAGKNLINLQDVEGNFVIKEELEVVKNHESGFITYEDRLTTNTEFYPKQKFAYVKKLGLFNWYFSSYEYLNNHYNEFKQEIVYRISNVRFINGGYVFLNQIDGTPLVLDGQVYTGDFNFLAGSDTLRMNVFKKELNAATSSPGGGYFNYKWNKIGNSTQVDKCSFALQYSEWGWIVGAGFYIDDADFEIQKLFKHDRREFLQKIIQLLIVLCLIIIIEILILNISNQKIFADFHSIFTFFKHAAESNQKIDELKLNFEEFKETAHAANQMIEIKEQMFADLLVQQEKALESDRLKSAFLANMSHEIRTPMNAILGFSSLLAEDNLDYLKRAQFYEMIKSNGDKLLTLINDIIDLSKIEANQLEIKNENFNLQQFVNSSYLRNKAILDSFINNTIDFVLENNIADHIDAFTDPHRINQIIDNLLSNAFKFTNQGQVILHADLNSGILKIVVSDNGIGIADIDLLHIFERFRQVENELQKVYAGTGLGLAITYNLVQMLKGSIQVKSELGKGTKFTVLLPIIFSPEP